MNIAALFSPEHGFLGREDRPGIQDTTDSATGHQGLQPVRRDATGPRRKCCAASMRWCTTFRTWASRFYTFETTMAYALEAAAKAGMPFYVLDRPNPITGVRVEGPLLDAANSSFVGYLAGDAGAARHDGGRTGEDVQRARTRSAPT